MKISNKYFSVLALSASFVAQSQVSHATKRTLETNSENNNESRPLKKIKTDKTSILEAMQKLTNGEPLYSFLINNIKNIPTKELKDFESEIISDDEKFDSWMPLIIMVFKGNSVFNLSLDHAKVRGERDKATPAALFNLGMMYYSGRGVAQDLNKAAKWYEKSAIQGNAVAQNNLGKMYQNGQGVAQDLNKAVEWYEKSAIQGNANARNNLAHMYYYGQGVAQDLNKAMEWTEKLAIQGNANAQNNLGKIYQNGQGVAQDLNKAMEWTEKLAIQGNANAQNNLGIMYQNGQGVAQDLSKAVEWYEKSAIQGSAVAQNNLGFMYQNGQGVAQDLNKAVEWYEKSAIQGNAVAQNNLGKMYQNGQGVAQDLNKAVEWYEKSAIQGNAVAQNNLGFMYYGGEGVEKDVTKSLKWFLESAQNKNLPQDLESKIKPSLKGFISFVPSTLSLDDENNFLENQKTLEKNISTLIRLHDIEKGINQTGSSFNDAEYAIPSLFSVFDKIVNFETDLLEIIRAYISPGFMVTCLQPLNVEDFKQGKSQDIKYYSIQDKHFLTFGSKNIETANKLVDLLLDTHKVNPVYTAISEITEIYSEIIKKHRVEAMSLQTNLRRNQNSEDQVIDMKKALTIHNEVIKDALEKKQGLTQVLNIPKQLQVLLIDGTDFRNKQYLKSNPIIESIFDNQ